jgi:hypothetical protein
MLKLRRRSKQSQTLQDRLRAFANFMRARAETIPDAAEKAATLSKADQADATAKLEGWLNSRELQPPK